MAIKKKRNKFVVPQEYNQSAIFAHGGNLYAGGGLSGDGSFDTLAWQKLQTPMTGLSVTGGLDLSKITQQGVGKLNAAGAVKSPITPQTPGLGAYLGAAQGAMQLGSQAINNLDTSGIGNEVVGTKDMSRSDILNTNVDVDSKQSNVGGQALSGAMTGASAGMAFGPLGAAIGGGVGLLAGGISSLVGNDKKQRIAEQAEQTWTNNLQAKNRQFNQQDMRNSMANFAANGGDLFAYGGQMPQQLTEFNASGTHEENPNGGILQGTGANGQPNLVEEGETKHEDYIFSDRLKVNQQISKDFKLPKGLNGKTFAQASKYLNREAKDRPNDPISNNGVKAHLAKLTAAQEGLKEQIQPQPQQGIPMEGQPNANILAQGYANGGYVDQTHYHNQTWQGANIGAMGGNIYDGTETDDNYLRYWVSPSNSANPLHNPDFSMYRNILETPFTDNNDFVPESFMTNQKAESINNPLDSTSTLEARRQQVRSNTDLNKKSNPEIIAFDPKEGQRSKYVRNGKLIEEPNWIERTASNIGASFDKLGSSMQGKDFSRYAPVAANMAMGISDMFEKPEVVKYGRVSPERVTARMDYQPIDTEWMNNKMNATYASTRDQMINNAGGNRAIAMAGLSGINQQQQNAVGEAYMKAQDINYGRKNQATQFNAGIEAQNVAAQNAAQQTNLQLQMQEMDANARNRAAKRNAARQAILNAASNIGDIGRENWAQKTGAQMTGYSTDATTGIITYADGSKYKKDSNGNLIKQS